jgi:DNA-3-methyladenine glycosylase II
MGLLQHGISDSLRSDRLRILRAAAWAPDIEVRVPFVPQSQDPSGITTHEIRVVTPYRLDFTVSALRRMATNSVDVYTADGRYLRALGHFAEPVIVSDSQPRTEALAVSVMSRTADTDTALMIVRRMLGTERDLSDFQRYAQAIRWLAPLERRMLGLKPPRYPTLFEACANAIVFQQVSLQSASAIMRRLVRALGSTVEFEGVPLAIFPGVEAFLGADDAVLRAAGLSRGKLATLRRAGEAIATGAISEALLDARSSADAAHLLCDIKGIGPWTAAVVLLRGLGRLDVFPGDDSSVDANLVLVTDERMDIGPALEMLGSQRGMLYFCLLLARLEARGEIGRASDVATRRSPRASP